MADDMEIKKRYQEFCFVIDTKKVKSVISKKMLLTSYDTTPIKKSSNLYIHRELACSSKCLSEFSYDRFKLALIHNLKYETIACFHSIILRLREKLLTLIL
jgi:hypothetical protein